MITQYYSTHKIVLSFHNYVLKDKHKNDLFACMSVVFALKAVICF